MEVRYYEHWEGRSGARSPIGSGAGLFGIIIFLAFIWIYVAYEKHFKMKYRARLFQKLRVVSFEGVRPKRKFYEDDMLKKYFMVCQNCLAVYYREGFATFARFCGQCGNPLFPSKTSEASYKVKGRRRKR